MELMYYNIFSLGDTLKFSVQMMDRDSMKSNVVEMEKVLECKE